MAYKTMKNVRLKIVSGGQTGVDRAALSVAVAHAIPYGGWIPEGRSAEDGIVPLEFAMMKELPNGGYRARTRKNVEDSDATLIVAGSLPLTGGTLLTEETAAKIGRPCLVVTIDDGETVPKIRDWLKGLVASLEGAAFTLNVAGPRESGCPGIYEKAKKLLGAIILSFQESDGLL